MEVPGSTFPLLSHGAGEPVAFRHDGVVRRDAFLHHVEILSNQLPERSFVLNLCGDRYVFMVAFAAAMVRGQTTLLAPSRATKLLEEIAADYSGCYCLSDDGMQGFHLPQHMVSLSESPDSVEVQSVPWVRADLISAIVFTSGSTGRPSANPKRWGDLVAGAELARRRFGYDEREGGSILATIPPQHMYGLEVSVLLPLVAGVAVHGDLPFFPEDIRKALESVPQPRTMFTTPTHLRACVDSDLRWPDVEFIVSATAPLSGTLAERVEQAFGTRVLEIYGCTEAGSMACRRTLDGDLWNFYDGITAYQSDGLTYVTASHLAEPVALNDFIEIESPTRIKLLGRHSDLVNVAGNRASLSDLNLKLNSIEGVRDGVFIMPEQGNGDRVSRLVALVVAPDLGKKDIMDALAERVNPVFLPRPLYMVDSLPRTVMGKLPHAELLELLERLRSSG
jgi:acyl-coenzyme A synthetase/AMP-(fatty) acid ligase